MTDLCQQCGDALPKRTSVQVRRYCSARCRKAASRLSQLNPSLSAGRCDIAHSLPLSPAQPVLGPYVSPCRH